MSKLKGRIAPFNPGSMSPELLQELLVGKDKILKTLVGNIVSAAKEKSAPPQQLLVAPRGYGKTHLINVVHSKLKKNRVFKKSLLLAFFKEEEHVSSYLDFLRRILRALKEECPSPELEEAFDQIFANPSPEMAVQTEAFLNEYIGDRLLVVLCENLGEIFDGLEEEGQKKLRAFLQNSGKISLLCTSQKLYEPLKVKNFPFYGFFSRTELEPFSDKEAWKLLKRLSDNAGDSELSEYLNDKEGKARVAAVCELTNGNPRLIALLSGFLNKEKLEGLTDAFMEMIETSLTPYYQEQMARLAPLQKRIIEILCEKGDGNPLSVKKIAEKALKTSQSISHQLRKMEGLGVLFSAKKSRETFYGMAEPLWRVSIEVKNNQEGILPVVVEFIKITKSMDEIFTSISESCFQQDTVYAHMVCALIDSCRLLEAKELDGVLVKRLMEIADSLPDDVGKAERLAQTLTTIFDRELVHVLLSTLRILNNHDELKEPVESRENKNSLIWMLGDQFLLKQSMASQKGKDDFLIYIKFVLLLSMGEYRPALLESITCSSREYAFLVPFVLSKLKEKNAAVNWLLRANENCKNHKKIKLGFSMFKPNSKDLWHRVLFPALEKFDSIFFKDEARYFLKIILDFVELNFETEILKLLEILGKKMGVQDQFVLFWLICGALVQKESKLLKFLEGNRTSVLEIFERWGEPEIFQKVLIATEAFAKGHDEQIASFPLEFRESLMEAKNQQYSELVSFLKD